MSRSPEAAAVSLPSQLRRETAVNRQRYIWRTDLKRSQPFWKGWYTGLSELFLRVPVPKVPVEAQLSFQSHAKCGERKEK